MEHKSIRGVEGMEENKRPEVCRSSITMYGVPVCALEQVPCERVKRCPVFSSDFEVTIKEILSLNESGRKDEWKKSRRVAE